jgi:dephospho-CoA kinase
MSGRRLLITGGIGSGKSTVLDLIRNRGVAVVSADDLGHRALSGEAFSAVAARWPAVANGTTIDRAALAEIVFSDAGALRELEAMVHPIVRRWIGEAVQEAGKAPLVVETPIPQIMDGSRWTVVVVDATIDFRRLRLRRRGVEEVDIDRRLAVQRPRREWLAMADAVVDNSGDIEQLEANVERLLSAFL